jgi:RNA polymerase sigma-70 factor, ECF subfamily
MDEASGTERVLLDGREVQTADGDRRDFERERSDAGLLFERYADDIYRYCRLRGCSPSDAEDLTAEVFAQALPRLKALRWRGRPVVAFLYTLAGRRVADLSRRRARKPATVPMSEVTEDRAAASDGVKGALARGLQQLPEREQLAVVLRIVHGYSFAEVAAAVGGSDKAVKSLVYRGLERLQATLRAEGIEP